MTACSFARQLSRSALFAAMLVAVTTSALASVEISSKPTHNMNCTGGVCAPTAKNADLNATDLANMLATSDIKVVTGAGAVTITVTSSLSWTSSHRLTLDANVSVSFRAPVVVAGQGAVTVLFNDGGTGGDLRFFPDGSIEFWDTSSDLEIGRQHYTLVAEFSGIRHLINKAQTRNRPAYVALARSISSSKHYKSSPIYTFSSGVFEGLGNTISNLYIYTEGDAGLITWLGATVHNLKLVSLVVKGNNGRVGGIAGINAGKITNSSVAGQVTNKALAGGLVGLNQGSIENSYMTGQVTGLTAGGLAGLNYLGGEIYRSHSDATVSGVTAGGLVGGNLDEYTCAGTTVVQAYATGSVSGSSYAGGLVGENQAAQILDSYSTGMVHTSSGNDGGFVGWDLDDPSCEGKLPEIQNSYSLGEVGGSWGLGGFIGYDVGDSALTHTYWDLDTSGINDPAQGAGNVPNDPGITGLTDAQLKSALPSGFDLAVWGESAAINNGYPYLIANPPQ